ncbi:hypothetical protein SEPCBS57363_005588 [Sporothrix epigloea]|uniref:Sfi1 spindle body domain-containing protein n=1 Tax=Sporothrix epigloea TaxID=1892477 RepID=A0ABP0DYQ1_9PEZI
MPSHAPLSLRDGRIRSSSVHQGGEPIYYSNEEIELLHEVVALAQDILPTLPKRDRLPNNALFHAADIIFPRYGVDPDTDDKLIRIIFMVGGMRSPDNLLDRFRTVLGGMGIELEYIPDHDNQDDFNEGEPGADTVNAYSQSHRRSDLRASPPSSHPPSPHMTVHSTAPSLNDGTLPVAQHVNGRRRRNSDSIAELVSAAAEDRLDAALRQNSQPKFQSQRSNPSLVHQHHRRQSDSLAVPLRNYKEHFDLQDKPRLSQPPSKPHNQASHKQRHIDPWLSQVPSYSAAFDKDEHARSLERAQIAEVDREEFDPDKDVPFVDDYTRSLDVLLASAPQRQHHQQQNGALPERIGISIGANSYAHLRLTHNYPHYQQLPIRPHEIGAEYGNTHDALSNSAHSSIQAAGSWTEPQSPRSRVSSLVTDSRGLKGASDTTIQDEPESEPAPKVDPFIMAKVADTYFMRLAFLDGVAIDAWRTTAAAHLERKQYAAQMDRELALSEALVVWSKAAGGHIDYTARTLEAGPLLAESLRDGHVPGESYQSPAAEHQKLGAQEFQNVDEAIEEDESDDETAAQYRQKQDERDKLMQRAARVYAITTMFNGVTHWCAMAKEETSRTKVARRHLLRRKVFGAWRDQMDIDHAKAERIALGWAIRRWTSALHAVQAENAQLAVQFYRRNLVIDTFWTWFRTHQEQSAEAWASNSLKKKAVETWYQSTTAAVSTDATAAHLARKSLLLTETARWIEQTESQTLTFLSIEEHENETYMRAALQDWSKEAFCRRQLRAIQETNESRSKAAAFSIWCRGTIDAQHRASQLDLDIVDDYTTHWRCETRLSLFRADSEYDLKADAVHSWVCAEKLAFFLRYRNERLLRKVCIAIKATFGNGQPGQHGEQEKEDRLARTADILNKTDACLSLVSAFRDLHEKREALDQIAEYLDHEAMATTCLGLWTAAVAEHHVIDKMARRGAFYVGTANALSGWSAHAQRVRKERLRTAYHTFRRGIKRQSAAKFLADWRNATLRQGSAVRGSGAYATADNLCYPHTIFTTLNHWILETNVCLFQQSVAAEADTELYLSRWRLQLAECEELGAAAAEHVTITQLTGRWDDWELQAVQAQARDHTASALLEKNDRRLGRRVLAVWQQELADQVYLVPVGPDEDYRTSFASSFGPRWRGEESRGSNIGGYSASLGYGTYSRAGAGIKRFGASLLSPLDPDKIENAHKSAPMARPITESVQMMAQRPFNDRSGRPASGGNYSHPPPGIDAPPGEAMPQPPHPPSSGTRQLRRLYRSTGTAPYRHEEQGDPSGRNRQAQQPKTFRASSSPETIETPARTTPYSTSHHLLQQRLQTAVQLADSVRLGPMSEFDEVEAVVGAELGEDNLGLRDYDDADVSSEGDEFPDLGFDKNFVPPLARDHHKLLYPNALHTLDTPTRPLFRPGSSERMAVPIISSSQRPLPTQVHSNLRFAATANTATPVDIGTHPTNVGSFSMPGDHMLATFRPDYPGLRKSAIVGAATASRAAYSSVLDPVTTTPMGPLSSPFERRLRATYGEEAGKVRRSYNNAYSNEDYSVGQHAPLATATPLRRLPLRASLAASTATARTGARVTFAEMDRDQVDE